MRRFILVHLLCVALPRDRHAAVRRPQRRHAAAGLATERRPQPSAQPAAPAAPASADVSRSLFEPTWQQFQSAAG